MSGDGKTRKTRLGEDVDLGALAVRTAGMSGAELESLINVAAMKVGEPRGWQLGVGGGVSSHS